MSYDLCIWDPEKHGPLPASSDAAAATQERLENLRENWALTLNDFVGQLVRQFEDDPQLAARNAAGFTAFWGSDPARSAATCQSAVYRLAISPKDTTRQISYAVGAAAQLGLVVLDDDNGICFLPDGKVLPEDSREMWEADLQEMRAGPQDLSLKKGDGRTFWERLGSDLLDALTSSRRS